MPIFCVFLRLFTRNTTREIAVTTITTPTAITTMAVVDKDLLVVSVEVLEFEFDDAADELEDDESLLIETELSLLLVFVCPPEVEEAEAAVPVEVFFAVVAVESAICRGG